MSSYARVHPDLLPYLAIACTQYPDRATWELERRLSPNPLTGPVVVAVLEGSAAWCQRHLQNQPRDVQGQRCLLAAISSKDELFYRLCANMLSGHGGLILDSCGHHHVTCNVADRLWQDACLAIFPHNNTLQHLMSVATQVHHRLEEENHRRSLGWEDQLHARISIGATVRTAVYRLENVGRNATRIANDLLPQAQAEETRLTPELVHVC